MLPLKLTLPRVGAALILAIGSCSPDSTVNTHGATGGAAQGGSSTGLPSGNNANGGNTVTGGNGFGSSGTSLLPMVDAAASTGSSGCRQATIAFVIDGSGSMCETFGNSTRWKELRTALLDKQNGLIYKINSLASVGMYLYDGSIDLSLATSAAAGPASTCTSPGTLMRLNAGSCPQIIEVAPNAMNAATIDAKYPQQELGGSTPTDKALNYVVDALLKARTPGQNLADKPQFIILATDGQPNDICTGGMGGDGTAQQTATVAAVDKAASMGIATFVISLASDSALQMTLDTVAKHGDPADPTAHSFSPMSSQDLVSTLTKLLQGAVGCLF